jgi:hypothetical protein
VWSILEFDGRPTSASMISLSVVADSVKSARRRRVGPNGSQAETVRSGPHRTGIRAMLPDFRASARRVWLPQCQGGSVIVVCAARWHDRASLQAEGGPRFYRAGSV